jgi:hypothetical protein
MIKITYTPPLYAKLLHWKLAISIDPQNKYSIQFMILSPLIFSSKETWAKEKISFAYFRAWMQKILDGENVIQC